MASYKLLFFPLLGLTLLLVSACSRTENAGLNNIAATVNGTAITEDDLYLLVPDGHGGKKTTSDMRTRALDHLIEQELLYQQGLKLGLDKDPKYRNLVANMEARISNLKRSELARRVSSTRIYASVNVSQEEVSRYYEQNKEMITTDLHLYILRFAEEEKARTARERLVKGSNFQSLAKESYPGREKENDSLWDPGFLHWHQISMEWAESVYKLQDGEISGVLGTGRTGWCIVQVVGRRKNPDAALDSMSAIITNRLRDQRVAEAYDVYLQDLKRSSRIIKSDERRNSS